MAGQGIHPLREAYTCPFSWRYVLYSLPVRLPTVGHPSTGARGGEGPWTLVGGIHALNVGSVLLT